MAEDGAQLWKQKYYDALGAHEAKERQWTEVEDLLRLSISRLTLAADGQDATLDRQLKELRDAIRDRGDSALLKRRIEAMSQTLAGLDRDRAIRKPAAETPSPLLALLEALRLPRGTGRQVKAVRKTLSKAEATADPGPQVRALAELIHQALTLSREEPAATEPSPLSSSPEKPGLLGRLFKREQRARDRADASVDPLATSRRLLEHLCDEAEARQLGHDLARLREQARRTDTEQALQSLGDELLQRLHPDEPSVEDLLSPEGQDDSASDFSVQEALLQLLEAMQLPEEFAPRLERLQDQLEAPEPPDHWSPLLEEIAGLVAEMRARVQREKQELEEFLQQVTERLQEVDEHLQGDTESRASVRQHTRELGAAVKEQVQGIESSVRQASDLDQLKGAVQAHLSSILQHMEAHRRAEEQHHREADEKVGALQSRLKQMEEETGQLRERIRRERVQAFTDPLTGIPNRLAFEERLEQEVARWRRFDTPLALLVWDVDRFKRINDTYGHRAGDKVLRTVAKTLQGQIRETDFLARYGGEEFVLIMTGTDLPVIQEVADKLRQSIADCGFHFRDQAVQITISCGISLFQTGDSPEQAFERADAALYEAKEGGRNRCVVKTGPSTEPARSA